MVGELWRNVITPGNGTRSSYQRADADARKMTSSSLDSLDLPSRHGLRELWLVLKGNQVEHSERFAAAVRARRG